MTIDPGELNERATIKVPVLTGTDVTYEPCHCVWVRAVPAGSNIFASSGLSVKSCEFTIRRRHFAPQWCLEWRGKGWFVTDVQELDHMWLKVTAAGAPMATAVLKRNVEVTENNVTRQELRPVLTAQVWLTEKYLGYDQTKAPAATSTTLVAVTCKLMEARPGDVMVINGKNYAVTICHTLDDTKNEYEIVQRGDA